MVVILRQSLVNRQRVRTAILIFLLLPLFFLSFAGPAQGAAPMNEARYRHTATVLGDGRVVVAGGFTSIGGYHYLSSAEFYDPATGNWSTNSLSAARDEHTPPGWPTAG